LRENSDVRERLHQLIAGGTLRRVFRAEPQNKYIHAHILICFPDHQVVNISYESKEQDASKHVIVPSLHKTLRHSTLALSRSRLKHTFKDDGSFIGLS
jgi:hypothetical protein